MWKKSNKLFHLLYYNKFIFWIKRQTEKEVSNFAPKSNQHLKPQNLTTLKKEIREHEPIFQAISFHVCKLVKLWTCNLLRPTTTWIYTNTNLKREKERGMNLSWIIILFATKMRHVSTFLTKFKISVPTCGEHDFSIINIVHRFFLFIFL